MSPHRIRRAAAVIAAGGVLAYPTEAVYGLGCDPRDAAAVSRLLALKRRSVTKGLILIAADFVQLEPYVHRLAQARMDEILASWPGPNTWLLPARVETPGWLTGEHTTLAVRVTAHPIAAALCRCFGGAIVSTSANLSDRRPARTALEVRRRLAGAPDMILVGDCGGAERPSRIRDGATGRTLRL
ncbi:Sua5/YciO/YrdC/YwlC family protein [Thiococcus pfennigii]|jgi:L-threonylcarbamoyladenylate synthase|uniref:Sua5/YciO/YrdC/YwlC family protein n=1 Tax=Thiococcus pfennigii TaxID=1057 RepID=UPI00190349EC|nr:Sua5/YciO/YrdC/YwlC family protein [Thiococcus pfennigii]MBK1701878.1 tRNA threonylcarbamoyladenosine biosynthesis protein RimN [Thiococcus pfennigii]MBK1731962.1 tRNA threonylcarbamoyladenosine biosynthesis protein RimN [Thiococcus pfennigii]